MNEEANTRTTTPPEAEQTGTTPPQAETTGTTQAAAENAAPQADIDKIVQKRLDRERKKWEAERQEAEERARMSEAERLKKDLEAHAAKVKEAEQRAKLAEIRAELKGEVADEKVAMKLFEPDRHLNDDGTLNLEALLSDYPILSKPAPQPETPQDRPRIPPANATKSPGAGDLRPEDFKGRDIAWARENLHRLKG